MKGSGKEHTHHDDASTSIRQLVPAGIRLTDNLPAGSACRPSSGTRANAKEILRRSGSEARRCEEAAGCGVGLAVGAIEGVALVELDADGEA